MNMRLFRNISVMLGCLAMLLFMVGCGSQSADNSAATSGSQTPENSADSGKDAGASASGDAGYDAAKAQSTYMSCAGCHGQNLEGGVGPALKGTQLSAEDILKVIENGQGTMPGGLVSGEDAKNLAAWIADQK